MVLELSIQIMKWNLEWRKILYLFQNDWFSFCVCYLLFSCRWWQKLNILLFIELEQRARVKQTRIEYVFEQKHHENCKMYVFKISWRTLHFFLCFFHNQSYLQNSLLFYNFVDAFWHTSDTISSWWFIGFWIFSMGISTFISSFYLLWVEMHKMMFVKFSDDTCENVW